jgi:hypothetical protein
MSSVAFLKAAHSAPNFFRVQIMLGIVALLLSALSFIAFGAAIMIEPVKVMAAADVSLTGILEIAEIRAFYGGLEIALGLLMLACLGKHRRKDGLMLSAVCYGGIAIARIIAIGIAGVGSNFLHLALAIEVALSVLCLFAWSREGKKHSIF